MSGMNFIPPPTQKLMEASERYVLAVHNYRTAIQRFGIPGGFEQDLEAKQKLVVEAINAVKEYHNPPTDEPTTAA